jgi:hypothetical protein
LRESRSISVSRRRTGAFAGRLSTDSKGIEMTRILRRPWLLVAATVFLALPLAASASGSGSYFNGFEQNTAGWHGLSGSTVKREPSFYLSDNGYATGVPSAAGDWHARLGIDPSPDTCASGAGPQPWYVGPYTDWGGESPFFPPGGFLTRVDIYLDVAWANTHPDRRFDWSSAIGTPSGDHRRDFVFNVGTQPGGFVVSASNNSTRCGAFPQNPGNQPFPVAVSGWYTFEHVFSGAEGGPLVVTMRLLDANGLQLAAWVRTDPTDVIGSTVGGNGLYGWFVQNEIDELAIDNSERTGIVSTPGCEIKLSDGGWITTLTLSKGTFGGNAKVDLDGNATGSQAYHDHRLVAPVDFKSDTVDAVVCDDDRRGADIYGTGTVAGVEEPVPYRIRLQDNGEGLGATPDVYGIVLPTIGYASGDRPLDGGNAQIR